MKMFCVGRNYVAHIKELENEVPKSPVIFMKGENALYADNSKPYTIPAFTDDLHYECEIVLQMKKVPTAVAEAEALQFVDSISLGIDFTARDIQSQLKEKSLPWELAKSFDDAAIIGKFSDAKDLLQQENIHFELLKNGAIQQEGNSELMIYKIPYLIHFISQYFKIEEGDYIFTGTPAGVGAVKGGEELKGILEGSEVFSLKIS